MKKNLVALLACACFAALLSTGCADKSTKVSTTPGEAPAGQTTAAPAQPQATGGGEPSAAPARPVEETTTAQAPSAAPAAQPGAQSAPRPPEQVVTPAAPAVAKSELLAKIHFEYDKSAITPESKALLDRNYDYLSKNSGTKVQIVGHCDERGTNEYNMALGDRRANSAKTYLVNRGIAAGRLDTLSKGEEEPADQGHDEIAWAKNRRAEFLVK